MQPVLLVVGEAGELLYLAVSFDVVFEWGWFATAVR